MKGHSTSELYNINRIFSVVWTGVAYYYSVLVAEVLDLARHIE